MKKFFRLLAEGVGVLFASFFIIAFAIISPLVEKVIIKMTK